MLNKESNQKLPGTVNACLCRYGELALKGGNRNLFEKALVDNISHSLRDMEDITIQKSRGRVYIKKRGGGCFSDVEISFLNGALEKVFGLTSFSSGMMCAPEMEVISDTAMAAASEIVPPRINRLGQGRKLRFRVRAKRADKKFPLRSKEVEIRLAERFLRKWDDFFTVDLEEADISLFCDIREKYAFVFFDRIPGPGGLPTGSNSPGLVLLSGGIDSPVAAWMMMKRGCRLDFLTFHSAPYTPPETLEKVERLVGILNGWQAPGKLYACNLAPVQKLIRDNCSERYRTILYRRMMMRIASEIAAETGAGSIVTGESVGQVASQTVRNMQVINCAAETLVLRPLVGMNKQEAVDLSKRIGTFDTSIEDVPDSCCVFAPSSPATSSTERGIMREEENFPFLEMTEKLVGETLSP